MDITLANGERTLSTKLCDVLEFWGSNGERCRQHQVCRVVQGLSYDLTLGIQWLYEFNTVLNWNYSTVQVHSLSIQGCDCGTQVEVELCSWKETV